MGHWGPGEANSQNIPEGTSGCRRAQPRGVGAPRASPAPWASCLTSTATRLIRAAWDPSGTRIRRLRFCTDSGREVATPELRMCRRLEGLGQMDRGSVEKCPDDPDDPPCPQRHVHEVSPTGLCGRPAIPTGERGELPEEGRFLGSRFSYSPQASPTHLAAGPQTKIMHFSARSLISRRRWEPPLLSALLAADPAPSGLAAPRNTDSQQPPRRQPGCFHRILSTRRAGNSS